jgi:transcriptional regulator with XRE-family HTH domain
MMAGAVAARLDVIKEKAGIRGRELALMVGATPQTVSRWQQGRVDPQPDHLQRILLDGATPLQLIQDGRIDDVLAVIEQLKSGAYV